MKTTPKETLAKLVSVYREINMLSMDGKSIIENAREDLGDKELVTGLDQLAKLIASEKSEVKVQKMKKFLDIVEEFG